MGAFFAQFVKDYGGELLAAILPSIVAAILASKLWTQRAVWIKKIIAAVARAVVAQVEIEYVEPTKAASGSDKLTPPQQGEAQRLAQGEVRDRLVDLGVQVIGSATPLIGAAIEKAVENAKQTLPEKTQALFP
jgi:hypothetical protein